MIVTTQEVNFPYSSLPLSVPGWPPTIWDWCSPPGSPNVPSSLVAGSPRWRTERKRRATLPTGLDRPCRPEAYRTPFLLERILPATVAITSMTATYEDLLVKSTQIFVYLGRGKMSISGGIGRKYVFRTDIMTLAVATMTGHHCVASTSGPRNCLPVLLRRECSE
jgi:hypothetical protein